MNFAEIIAALKDLSPWALLVVLVILSLRMLLTHREKMKERTDHDELLDLSKAAHEVGSEVKEMLATATDVEQAMMNQQLDILNKIAQELVNMNASSPGSVISRENAKRIIRYQWSWCRDETIRVITNSITNNHFRGREKRVAQRVFRAWRRAAKDARESVDKLSGMEYPYAPLFDLHISLVWDRAWSWALPIYHEDYIGERAEMFEDLRENVTQLCTDIVEDYFALVEDIDEGVLYAADDSAAQRRVPRTETEIPGDGLSLLESMSNTLKAYEVGLTSNTYDIDSTNTRMRLVEQYNQEKSTDRYVKHDDDEDEDEGTGAYVER